MLICPSYFFKKEESLIQIIWARGDKNIRNKLQLCQNSNTVCMASSHKYHNYLVTPYNVWPKLWSHVFKRWHVFSATTTNANGQGDFTFFPLGCYLKADLSPKMLFVPKYVLWRKQPIPTVIYYIAFPMCWLCLLFQNPNMSFCFLNLLAG